MTDASVPLFRLEPGLFLRPRPSHMAKDTAAVKLGGGPQLPDDIDWPKNLTFYAQIDLSKLARSVILDGNTYAIDKLPDRGTLFVFLPLFDGQVYDGANAKVFHVEADVSHLPERAPPDDLGNLRNEETNWSSYWLKSWSQWLQRGRGSG